ncbi:hypothetical protein DSM104635_01531 [Terricaulis silvestris]|uniref:Uncharacterized protein n=1 Tax=Terricaulis silvestris TaxID=2686094 RepID=A0A6I6ML05_9CAUL|nr:hypothetical protein DSM104635_01531 [Terricaulis silvestris]
MAAATAVVMAAAGTETRLSQTVGKTRALRFTAKQ